MPSWRITSPLETALDARKEILSLTRDVLNKGSLDEAEKVAELLTHRGRRKQLAIASLARLLKPYASKTSRPLFYLFVELRGLPFRTRDVVRYSGDYVDMLTKELSFERLGGIGRHSSLGSNAKNLGKRASDLSPLPQLLERFASFLYTPSKHDFELPLGRAHRFTSREAVLSVYLSIELGARILAISKQARAAADADDWYSMGGRWGSSTRVLYEGS